MYTSANKPVAPEISSRKLAVETEGFSGAEITSICNLAGLGAVRRAIQALKDNPAA